VFALPSVVINSALLAQCDALWAGACVLAISAMIRGQTLRSLIWCGIAFAFKAQAAFIAPFIIGSLIGRRAPAWQWAVPALVFIGSMVPAWLAGWPAAQLAMVYPAQASWWASPGRLANPWIFVTVFASGPTEHVYWIGYASAVVASLLIGWRASVSTSSRQAMLLLALLSSLALPFCFPKMLERYYFLADVLSLALAISCASPLTIIVAVAVEFASLLSLLSYMYFYAAPYPTLVGAGCASGALLITCLLLRRSGRGDTVHEQGRGPTAAKSGG
jgi:Gpi18-like mannosyltransferase